MNTRIEQYQKSHEVEEEIMCRLDANVDNQDGSVDPSMLSQSQSQEPPNGVPPAIKTNEDLTYGTDHNRPFLNKVIDFYWANEFVILVVIAILIARAYPPLGAEYLYPQITATWIAVVFIFGELIKS